MHFDYHNNGMVCMQDTINIGLMGFGTVGSGVAKMLLSDERPFLRGRDFYLELSRIADLDIITDRGVAVPEGMLTTHVEDILNDRDIGIVVELIGGYEPARTFTLRAFERGPLNSSKLSMFLLVVPNVPGCWAPPYLRLAHSHRDPHS